MRLLGIVGSPRREGNSFYLVQRALEGAKEENPLVETKIIQLADLRIEPCRACESCAKEPFKCVNQDDDFEMVFEEMKRADGILLASPRYGPFGASPSKLQALLERLINVNILPGNTNPNFVFPLEGKPCGLLAVSVEGRQNNLPVLHSLEQYVLAYRMHPIHTKLWPFVGVSGRGNEKGDVLKDTEAMENAKVLGRLLVKAIKTKERTK
jgi:multimeric flavodoxin WrbA